MQTFRLSGDDKHLYFKNNEGRPEREERAEVMKILTQNGCVIGEKIMGPDCDLYTCRMNELRFAVCVSLEDGVSICVDDIVSLEKLEGLFEES